MFMLEGPQWSIISSKDEEEKQKEQVEDEEENNEENKQQNLLKHKLTSKINNDKFSYVSISQYASSGSVNLNTGSSLWDASTFLVHYFEKNGNQLNKLLSLNDSDNNTLNILELGAGTGFSSICLLYLFYLNEINNLNRINVIFTDIELCIDNLKKNVKRNELKLKKHLNVDCFVNVLDWVDFSELSITEKENYLQNTLLKQVTMDNNSCNVIDNEDNHFDIVVASDCIWLSDLFEPFVNTIDALFKNSPKLQLFISNQKRSEKLDQKLKDHFHTNFTIEILQETTKFYLYKITKQ
ncbi:hypothetical protein ABK040_007770 [Willaertia magna]